MWCYLCRFPTLSRVLTLTSLLALIHFPMQSWGQALHCNVTLYSEQFFQGSKVTYLTGRHIGLSDIGSMKVEGPFACQALLYDGQNVGTPYPRGSYASLGTASISSTLAPTSAPAPTTPQIPTPPPTSAPQAPTQLTTHDDCETTDGDECEFPFTYNSVKYDRCTSEVTYAKAKEKDIPTGIMWCGTKAEPTKDKDWGYCEPDACGGEACKRMQPSGGVCEYGNTYCDGLITRTDELSCDLYCNSQSGLVCTKAWINPSRTAFPCKGALVGCDVEINLNEYHVCRCSLSETITNSPTVTPPTSAPTGTIVLPTTLCEQMGPKTVCENTDSHCVGEVERTNFRATCDSICGSKNLQCTKAWGPEPFGTSCALAGALYDCFTAAPSYCRCGIGASRRRRRRRRRRLNTISVSSLIVTDYGECGSSFVLATLSSKGFDCLTDETSSLMTKQCLASTTQKWEVSGDQLVGQSNNCLMQREGAFVVDVCGMISGQSWTMSNFAITLNDSGTESCVDANGFPVGCSQIAAAQWALFNGQVLHLPLDGDLNGIVGSGQWVSGPVASVTSGHDNTPLGAYKIRGQTFRATFSAISRLPGIGGLTVMMWVKSYDGSGKYWEFTIGPSLATMELTPAGMLSCRTSAGTLMTTTIEYRTWSHVAVVWEEELAIYYFVINGQKQTTSQTYTLSEYDFTTLNEITVGDTSNLFTYDLDELQVFQWTLEVEEIKKNYDCTGGADGWYAYNDFVSTPGAAPSGITTHGYNINNLPLVDIMNGENLNAKITTSTTSNAQVSPVIGANCSLGSDCSDLFFGKINLLGNVILSEFDVATIEISGLDPSKTYELVLTANADDTRMCRFTKVVLSGIDYYVEDSSRRVVSHEEDTVSWCPGDNTFNGHVVRWRNIFPGLDGRILVTTSVNTDLTGGSLIAYAMSAMMLHVEPFPPVIAPVAKLPPQNGTAKKGDDTGIIIMVLLIIIMVIVGGIMFYHNRKLKDDLMEEREQNIRSGTNKSLNASSLGNTSQSSAIRLTTHLQTFKYNDLRDPVLIGEGAFKKVFSADLRGTPVAVAVLKVEPASHLSTGQQEEMWKSMSAEFFKEVHLNSSLSHQNIVQFMGIVETVNDPPPEQWQAGGLCFVSELYPRGSLYDVLYKDRTILTLADQLKIAIGICRGLAFLHYRNIVHLDLKPMNVLLTDDNNPKICDFGLAEIKKLNAKGNLESALPSSLKGAGTMRYWAPEQFPLEAFGNTQSKTAKSKITDKTDIWALGCVLSELFTGVVTWSEKDVMYLTKHVAQGTGERSGMHMPPELDNIANPEIQSILRECFFRNSKKRPGADKLVTALCPMAPNLKGQSSSSGYAHPVTPSGSQLPPHSRKPPRLPPPSRNR